MGNNTSRGQNRGRASCTVFVSLWVSRAIIPPFCSLLPQLEQWIWAIRRDRGRGSAAVAGQCHPSAAGLRAIRPPGQKAGVASCGQRPLCSGQQEVQGHLKEDQGHLRDWATEGRAGSGVQKGQGAEEPADAGELEDVGQGGPPERTDKPHSSHFGASK